MEVGVGVWVKNEEDGDWIPSTVVSKVPIDNDENAGFEIGLRDDGGNEVTLTVGEAHQDLDNCKLRNDDVEGGVENLIKLPYLHEPAILHCLEQRYANSDIYTYTGPILIAVNPFKIVPLYTTQVLETYYNLGLLRSQGIESPTELPPHIYAIADAAFRDMMDAIHAGHTTTGGGSSSSSSDKKKNMRESANADQAILVSGESGAGKTESTKIVLRYLTTVGNSSGTMEVSEGSVMDKVLQSNPILEAFGNAKTIRNDNSSRFGKYIDLNFNRRGHLIGGTISTYLLEKVRIHSVILLFFLFSLFMMFLSPSLLLTYCCLLAFSDTT
jgi:myosin-5